VNQQELIGLRRLVGDLRSFSGAMEKLLAKYSSDEPREILSAYAAYLELLRNLEALEASYDG
jgi:hypothetical protein